MYYKVAFFLENEIERKKVKKARKKERQKERKKERKKGRKIINLVLYNLEVSYPLYKVLGVITRVRETQWVNK